MTPPAATILLLDVTTYPLPTHLSTLPPQDTFRYIAAWAENAAECFDEIDSEYDPGSERAISLRQSAVECAAQMFAAMAYGNQEAQWRIGRGLDQNIHKLKDIESSQMGG